MDSSAEQRTPEPDELTELVARVSRLIEQVDRLIELRIAAATRLREKRDEQ
jgi:hypothetical protein